MKNTLARTAFTLATAFLLIHFTTLTAQNTVLGTYALSLNGNNTGSFLTLQQAGAQYQIVIKAPNASDVQANVEVAGETLMGKDENGTVFAIMEYNNNLVLQYGTLYTFVMTKIAATPTTNASQAKPVSQVQTTNSLSPLAAKFKDRQLIYLYTGNGYSTKKRIFLYANGTFVSDSDESYSSNDAYSNFNYAGANQSAGKQRWDVKEQNGAAYLILGSNNYRISYNEKNQLLLNGNRYFNVELSYR
jgi:hypothetical protein